MMLLDAPQRSDAHAAQEPDTKKNKKKDTKKKKLKKKIFFWPFLLFPSPTLFIAFFLEVQYMSTNV